MSETKRIKRHTVRVMRRTETKAGVCPCGAQLRGSSSPLSLSLAPARSLQGVPGFPRKNILAPITPEPSAGLFTLAWLHDSFTDVTYRHTGTLSHRRRRSEARGERGEGRRRTRDLRMEARMSGIN